MSQSASTQSETTIDRINAFVSYAKRLKGDEKGESQVFCDRLFRAFGHQGIMEAGGTLEFRIHKARGTRFADLIWRPRVLIEMKKRGERLERHYRQAFEYWLDLVPDRPQYMVLCNFDEFWIYDLNYQLDEPMDRVKLGELPERYTALNFLFPEQRRPLFENDRVDVTRKAAGNLAALFTSLIERKRAPVSRETAQRFVLQSILASFAEDIGLFPRRGFFTEIVEDCQKNPGESYDRIGGLFRQMADRSPATGGRYEGVSYFNGGLFNVIEPIDLRQEELTLLHSATKEKWNKVHPAIFGSIFEGSLSHTDRHAFGAHFTSEVDIYKVVLPTIVRPWRERIAAASRASDLLQLRRELLDFKVLDPACGSGNFLYIAYRELKRIELELLDKIYTNFGRRSKKAAGDTSLVSAAQFYGIDINRFAVELAKVTLMIAKTLALDEARERLATGQQHLPFDLADQPLPLDNLDANFIADDALITEESHVRPWPAADVIIGNPPFLGAKRLKPLHGDAYVNRLRALYKDVPGMADFCVYWFRRAHDHLPSCTKEHPTSGRAGLVGTQNIRSNKSRVGGLDYICATGTITEAVDNQPWSGEANVHVSIVNWTKSQDSELLPKSRRLWTQPKKSSTKRSARGRTDESVPEYDLIFRDATFINSSLSDDADVSGKLRLSCNVEPKRCFQGKIPGYNGFLVDELQAMQLRMDSAPVVVPYLTGRELLDDFRISRWIIDFENRDMVAASAYASAFAHCRKHVLPAIEKSLKEARDAGSDMAAARAEHLERWWQLWNRRDELTSVLKKTHRYIGCSRVTRRPVMVFLKSTICPSDLVQVFAFDDDYSFGILQSGLHFEWFRKSSRMKVESDTRYAVRDVFETFPWPQQPTLAQVKAVAAASKQLRNVRASAIEITGGGLRDLYRTLELPGKHPLRSAHEHLDEAVRAAYGIGRKDQELAFLLDLNQAVAAALSSGGQVIGPGLPSLVTSTEDFVSTDFYSA